MRRLIAVTLLTSFLAGPALAADHPGKSQPARNAGGTNVSIQIAGSDRGIIQEYYGQQIAQGHCPPGLAKKNNGCQPPGQAKKWARGQRLPQDLIYYALPPTLAGRLHAPAGARYVRVAADILLIAAGTGLVLDAIEDLGRS